MSGFGQGAGPGGDDGIREEVPAIAPLYEVRGCWRCSGGGRVHEAADPAEVPRLVPCPDCGGTGRVSVYLYPKPRGRRQRGRS